MFKAHFLLMVIFIYLFSHKILEQKKVIGIIIGNYYKFVVYLRFDFDC